MSTIALLVAAALVVVLYLLIASINRGEHFAPQAYHRSKRGGAPVAYGYESLGPRRRRHAPIEDEPGPGSAALGDEPGAQPEEPRG